MREQLIQYVDLLFAGADNAEEIKQEILQNTLDRYDDLIAQGKTPQAAYQHAISGIGDVSEIINSRAQSANQPSWQSPEIEPEKPANKWYKGVAIALFILCAVPILILENAIGVCLCLAMVAAGVALLVIFGKEDRKEDTEIHAERRSPANKAITGAIGTIGLCVYLLVSFTSGAWAITWIIFPIMGCICGIVDAIFDLKKSTGSAIVRIVLFVILISILAPLGFGIIYSVDGSYSVGYTSSHEGSISAEDIRNIEIEWVSGSITVVPGDTDLIMWKETVYSESTKPMIFKQVGDTLHIQFSESTVQIGINLNNINNVGSKDLVITVPSDWICEELTIDSVSADVDVSNLTCKEIELSNVSGTSEFENCNADALNLETVSGGITYRGQLTTLECESVSADCEIYATNHPSSISMDGVSCDLTLYLPEDCGFTANVDSMSGDFSSNFPTTSKGGAHVYGDGSCRIESDSMSGDINIRKAS